MITIKDKSTIASLSELRTQSDEILKQLADHKVILQKHNKPVAVMLDYKEFAVFEKLLDLIEDYTLNITAVERDKTARGEDFVDIDKW